MIDLGALAVVAFVVNIIIEMTKEIGVVNKIPTKLYAVIISVIVNFAMLGIKGTAISISVICSTLLGAFLIAYIAIFGYDNIYSVLKKFLAGQSNEQ